MPSISFVQSAGNKADLDVLATSVPSVAAGSLLVCVTAYWINGDGGASGQSVVTDDKGNTWQPGPVVPRYQGGSNIFWGRTFWAFNAASGTTSVTLTLGGSGVRSIGMSVLEFAVPTTLIGYSSDILAELQFGTGHGASSPPFQMWTAVNQLPSDGLMVAGGMSDRGDMVLDAGNGFTGIPVQVVPSQAVACYAAYAIGPQGPQRCTWTKPNLLSVESSLTLQSFIDTAGFAARPRPIQGKGASW